MHHSSLLLYYILHARNYHPSNGRLGPHFGNHTNNHPFTGHDLSRFRDAKILTKDSNQRHLTRGLVRHTAEPCCTISSSVEGAAPVATSRHGTVEATVWVNRAPVRIGNKNFAGFATILRGAPGKTRSRAARVLGHSRDGQDFIGAAAATFDTPNRASGALGLILRAACKSKQIETRAYGAAPLPYVRNGTLAATQ
jgi:hypothetical protein